MSGEPKQVVINVSPHVGWPLTNNLIWWVDGTPKPTLEQIEGLLPACKSCGCREWDGTLPKAYCKNCQRLYHL